MLAAENARSALETTKSNPEMIYRRVRRAAAASRPVAGVVQAIEQLHRWREDYKYAQYGGPVLRRAISIALVNVENQTIESSRSEPNPPRWWQLRRRWRARLPRVKVPKERGNRPT